jgi:hypothetical protein
MESGQETGTGTTDTEIGGRGFTADVGDQPMTRSAGVWSVCLVELFLAGCQADFFISDATGL